MIKRRPFQGVLNILSFNRHFYIAGLLLLALILASDLVVTWPGGLLTIVVVAFVYGLAMPLIVSAYVYDLSGYYKLVWLDPILGSEQQAQTAINVNAGFDEMSYLIQKKLPTTKLSAFDFYDASRHTEPAIVRARKVTQEFPGTQVISSDDIPLPDDSVDLVFLLSAIHEIRSHDEKIRFLKECRRICKPAGKVILVEHLRDLPNFLAFTVGFTHFFSRRTWIDAIERSGFSFWNETKFTPFMSIFTFKP